MRALRASPLGLGGEGAEATCKTVSSLALIPHPRAGGTPQHLYCGAGSDDHDSSGCGPDVRGVSPDHEIPPGPHYCPETPHNSQAPRLAVTVRLGEQQLAGGPEQTHSRQNSEGAGIGNNKIKQHERCGNDHGYGRKPEDDCQGVLGRGELSHQHVRARREEGGGKGHHSWNIDQLGARSDHYGHPEKRLPNTLSLSFRGVEANTLLAEIGEQVAASAGAACHAGEVDLSSVLEAMKVPVDWAMGTVRFSVGRGTTEEQIDRTVEVVAGAVRRLQNRAAMAPPVLAVD